jgi:MFS family permease
MTAEKGRGDKWYYSFLPYNIASGGTNTLIPLFVTEALAGSVAQVGLISAATSMASVPSHILWGDLSDTARKRRVFVLIGFGGLALSLLLMGLSTNFYQYMVANVLMGVLVAAAAPVGTVLILESFKKEDWAKQLASFSKVGGIGWVLGLVLGTVWLGTFIDGDQASAMRALFLLAAGLALVSMYLAYRWVPEPSETIDRSKINGWVHHVPMFHFERMRFLPQRVMHTLKLSSEHLRPENFPTNLRKYYVYVLLTFMGFLTFYVGLPTYLKHYVGMSSTEVFIVYLASSTASALTYTRVGQWATRFGGKKVQSWGVIARTLLFPSFFLVTLIDLPMVGYVVVFCALHAMVGFAWALISVSNNYIVSNCCKPSCRAESSGMYSAMQGSATVVGALMGGYIAQYLGYMVVFVASSCILVVSLAVLSRIDADNGYSDDHAPKAPEQEHGTTAS